MEVIGAFLMVFGFVVGVYCGILLSSRNVLFLPSGEINQSKMFKITLLTVASAALVFVGQFLFTLDTMKIYQYQP
ncbi:MAG TPA: hypothetical protein VIK89_00360 [Cytophagaceae bacterium]